MKKSATILFSTALLIFALVVNFSFDFGNDPNKQKFKKMTVMYRDFQGGNKTQYKFEEVTKNDNGWIISHNFYDETGKLIEGSYSLTYDNNGNVKDKKNIVFDKSKGKDVVSKTTYVNSFTDGKIKRAIITEKENVAKNDTIDYLRNSGGVVIEKKSRSNGSGTSVFYNEDERIEKEMVYVKGKSSLTRVFVYDENGIKSVTGTNVSGKEVEKITFIFDKGKLAEESRVYEDSGKNFKAAFNYNPKGQVTIEERTEAGKRTNIHYEYDDKGMVAEINIKNEKAVRLNERTYSYE